MRKKCVGLAMVALFAILVCFQHSSTAGLAMETTCTGYSKRAAVSASDDNGLSSKGNSLPQAQVLLIENSSRPSGKNSRRVIELKPLLSVSDQPPHFFFKYPSEVKLSRRGDVFVLDDEEILQFDSSGKFLRNYFKKGQGPGEMQYVRDIAIDGENLAVFDSFPKKVCRFDFERNLLSEFKISQLRAGARTVRLIHVDGSNYYLAVSGIPDTGWKMVRADNPNYFQVYNEKTEQLDELGTFSVPAWVITGGGAGAMVETCPLRIVPYRKNQFVISHTEDYLLKIFDAEKKEVVAAFKRKYKRVKIPEAQRHPIRIAVTDREYAYKPTHYNDILEVLVVGDLIWALTSTVDKSKGLLVDVFNGQGQYVDCFYLKFPFELNPGFRDIGINLAVDQEGKTLWATVKNPDETFSMKKFQL